MSPKPGQYSCRPHVHVGLAAQWHLLGELAEAFLDPHPHELVRRQAQGYGGAGSGLGEHGGHRSARERHERVSEVEGDGLDGPAELDHVHPAFAFPSVRHLAALDGQMSRKAQ